MRKFIGLVLLIMQLSVFSQVKLYPNLGIGKTYNRMLDKNDYLDVYNDGSTGFRNDGSLVIYMGFEIEKKFKSNNFDFKYGFTYLSLAATTYSDPSKESLYGAGFDITGTGQNTFGLFYSKDLEIRFNNIFKSKNPNVIRKNKSVIIRPYGGVNINHIQWSVNWGNTIGIQNDSLPSDVKYGWDVYDEDNKYKAVKNKNGVSVETGVRLTFKTDKERLSFIFMYNQGITDYLQSRYTKYITKIDKTVSSRFATNGTFISICASYPITIQNPKGQRRSDRKLLN